MESSTGLTYYYQVSNLVMMLVMTVVVVLGATFVSWIIWKIYKIAQKHELTMQKFLSQMQNLLSQQLDKEKDP